MGVARHFLNLSDFDAATLEALVAQAMAGKKARAGKPQAMLDKGAPLEGRLLAMIFEHPSTRTRVSFDVAMRQLGGQVIVLNGEDLQLGRGESIADTARVLSRYVDAIMIRSSSHDSLLELAEHATVPVINGLTDKSHPCQIMADLLTFEEHKGSIRGRSVAWSGDGNNVVTSWVHAAALLDIDLRLACPEQFDPSPEVLDWAQQQGVKVRVFRDPFEAVQGVDCVITDAWVSMGDKDAAMRHKALQPYQVNAALMAAADENAIFMHCLPAHRGEEVTDEVMDGLQSVVFDEAENRMHAQKAVLSWCFAGE